MSGLLLITYPTRIALAVDTYVRRFKSNGIRTRPSRRWHLVFFSQFLVTAGLIRDWVRTCPLQFSSKNAPLIPDLLGTITLAILAGQNRYAHVTALRADTVNPQCLGISRVCSEDSVRRAFVARTRTPAPPGRPVRCNNPGSPRCACLGCWIST